MLFIRLSHVTSNPPIVELSALARLGTQCVRSRHGQLGSDVSQALMK